MVPCYPVCHLLPTFIHRGFSSTPPVPPMPRISLRAFLSTPPVAPPPLIYLDTTQTLSGSELPKVFDYASMPSIELSARSRVLANSRRPEQYSTG